MRGEHRKVKQLYAILKGSSPHARGTHDQFTDSVSKQGIIPACAGNTQVFRQGGFREGDHPRMRGEHLIVMSE